MSLILLFTPLKTPVFFLCYSKLHEQFNASRYSLWLQRLGVNTDIWQQTADLNIGTDDLRKTR